jgi:predicted aldo/keto reductase-like oxidoreductase
MADPRVSMLLLGVSKASDVDTNIEIITANTEYTLEDRAMLAEFAAKAYEHPAVTELEIA